jgi:hypothetical protein
MQKHGVGCRKFVVFYFFDTFIARTKHSATTAVQKFTPSRWND